MAQTTTAGEKLEDDKLVLTPRQTAKSLQFCMDIKQPAMIWGKPGIGKSEVVDQARTLRAKALGLQERIGMVQLRASLLEPPDLRGIPYVVGGECRQAVPSILPQVARDGEEGILFLDELPQAPPSVQGALLQLVLDRKIEGWTLPEKWHIIAAGNDRNHHAGGYKLISALSRRFANYDMIVSAQEWREWAFNKKLPQVVLAFVNFRPGNLDMDDLRQRVGANPRSMAVAARMIQKGLDEETALHDLAGVLGKGVASELMSFLEVWQKLPNPDEVIKRPQQAPVPTDIATLFAICGALAARATPENIEAIFQYGNRLPQEYNALLTTDCVRLNRKLSVHKAWLDYVAKYGDTFLGK